ncbi:MAG TPA: MASE1 domain-containing protein [Candidatus Dormibacteraeota bacterium]
MATYRRAGQAGVRLAVVAVVYWLAARLSLNLALVHGQVTPLWPPTGIALVAFLIFGRQMWPAIYAAAFAVNLPIGPTPIGAAAIAVGNTLAPLVAAELLRMVGFRRELDRFRDALAIIFLGALAGMTISASVGTAVLFLGGVISSAQAAATWAVWWTGDAMGVLLVAPFLLGLFDHASSPRLTPRNELEITGLLILTGLVTYLLFLNDLRFEYLVLPLIMLAAWRFRLRGAAPAALAASIVAIICAVHGVGPFAEESLFEKMATLQVFNVSLALASFVLASFIETREREEKMSRRLAAAEAANEAKTRFLHLAAHELRTPITVISGYLTMLSDGSLGAAPQGWAQPLAVLGSKTKELNRLVTELLEASRAEAKAVPMVSSTLDLRDVVREAAERARPRAELLEADVVVDLPGEPVMVKADVAQLGRILDNLLNNAMTYSLEAPRVRMTLSADRDRVAVRVIDQGVGVPMQERERIFEQFHRLNQQTLLNIPGTGLGLYISRQLAEANGGTLTLESSSSEGGTVFALSLPVISSSADRSEVDAALMRNAQPIAAEALAGVER